VGDLVKAVDDDFDVDGNYRVSSIERWFDSRRVETTRIGITDISKLTLNGPYLLNPGEKSLIDAYMGVDELGKIVHFPDTRTVTEWFIKRHFFHDSFEKIDTDVWTKTLDAGCTIEATIEGGLPCAQFHVSNVALRLADLKTQYAYWGNTKWELATRLKLSTDTYIYAMWGAYRFVDVDNYWYIFFAYDEDAGGDGEFHISCCSVTGGVGGISGEVITPTPDVTQYHNFKLNRLSATKCHFFIDDTVVATVTNNVPSEDLHFYIRLRTEEAATKDLYLRSITAQELKA